MSNFTKEELRDALIDHGVPSLPPLSAKKDQVLSLYEEHIGPLENGTNEFSSDDEVSLNMSPTERAKVSSTSKVSKSSSKSPQNTKKIVSDEESLSVDCVDVEALDDDELFSLLKENGIDVGPIVASTRPFYKKKLKLVLKGEGMDNTSNGGEVSDTDPETEPEDDQPAGTVTEETSGPRVTRAKISSSSKSPKSASKSPLPLNTSGLRQRLTVDETDSGSPLTPTPRRSIHSYEVTGITEQVVTRNKDEEENRDIKHTNEINDSAGVKTDLHPQAKSSESRIYFLIKIIIFISILCIIYVVFTTPTEGITPVDQIMDAINTAQANPITANPDVETGNPPAPPSEASPDAGNVVDV